MLFDCPKWNGINKLPLSQQGHKSTLRLCAFCTTGIVDNNKMQNKYYFALSRMYTQDWAKMQNLMAQ